MKDYKVKPNETGYVHVRFTKIMKGKGKRTFDVHRDQIFSVREFEAHKKSWEKFGFAGVTQQDEFEILHDPRNVNEAETEADEIRKYLTDNDVKFDSRLGLKKLKELKEGLNI